jgi:hypothetical protein
MPVQPGGAIDPASRIEAILNRQERLFRQSFETAISNIKDANTLSILADLLEQGRFEEAIIALDAAAVALGGVYGAAVSEAARDTARFLSEVLTVSVSFDQTNIRAVQAIQRNSLRLIREFSSEQRLVLRQALQDGITRGLNPIDQARNFRSSVGLTQRQLRSVENYRALLTTSRLDGLPSTQALNRALRDGRFDRTIRSAIQNENPLRPEQVERIVNRYKERLIKHRAEVIGRTEALRSAHEGTEEMYRQAIDTGQINPEQLRRKWVTAGDERVRTSHSKLNGQVKGIDEPWEADSGTLRFPGDPLAPASETIQCRCVLSTTIEG